MDISVIPLSVRRQIKSTVDEYVRHRADFWNLGRRVENDLIENQELKPHIHSTKFREKDPDHLRDKLYRQYLDAKEKKKPYFITPKNLFRKIDDLAGVRLLHINREQLGTIDPIIRKILAYHKYRFREKPKAYTWDIENQGFFRDLGFRVEANPRFYTSVHYVVQPHMANIGCELQVRTLAEELWGEVSHRVDYPERTQSVACREQLAVLARTASGCTRLVDSIFSTVAEFERLSARRKRL